ncbi:MAG: TetR/AcrR family transcriptional regulator [Methanobrevibacter sp.]|nr:TetR/AcrR family transcriptional regulator [Methanobrevibacter sp.]
MDTKELILEKTLKLMIEKQNSLLSIREISEATGIATGGIYHYFSNKKQIYDELIEKYYINYVKLDLDKLMLIKGNAKEKIHDVMTEIFKQYQSRIIIKTTEDEIDYRTILFILTPIITRYENSWECYHGIIKELNDILTEIVEEGQKNRQIRQDISSEDIAGSLIILFTGIEYKWELYFIDDMVSEFENQFKLEWEKIKFRG